MCQQLVINVLTYQNINETGLTVMNLIHNIARFFKESIRYYLILQYVEKN